MAKREGERAPLIRKNHAGNVAWCRVWERLSYTKIRGIWGYRLIQRSMLYSIFFFLCSINKKKNNFNNNRYIRGKWKFRF
jgi:hypothetical protein